MNRKCGRGHETGGARRSRLRRPAVRLGALVAGLTLLGGVLTACGDGRPPTVDYLIDARVDTYNANTATGNADGSLMALTRVLPGFSYFGPQGQVIDDRDIGTVTVQPGPVLTLRYDINPLASFSDGEALDCDDLMLAAAALGGRHDGFDAATHAGYRDIDKVTCVPGEKGATVTFNRDRDYADWESLFGAGTLLPAHVVAREAQVPDLVAALRGGDPAVMDRIAEVWNTGFDLAPGEIDPARFPALGPYRIESYSSGEGLVLTANEAWWGEAPATDRITVWPRGTDTATMLGEGRVNVVDTGDLGLAGRLGDGGDNDSDNGDGDNGDGAATDTEPLAATDPLTVETLVLAQRGVFGDLAVRQAFAHCVPRSELAADLGAGGPVWNLRTVTPASPLGDFLNGQYARRYPQVNIARARELLADRDGDEAVTVRIGYLGRDSRRADLVSRIARSCEPAGIEVVDAAGPDLEPDVLGEEVDALLVANGYGFAASGAADPIRHIYSLYGDDPLNFSGFDNGGVNRAIDELSVTSGDAARLDSLRQVETAAWDAVVSIPLFGTVRLQEAAGVDGVVAGQARNGTGWNMDRWVLE